MDNFKTYFDQSFELLSIISLKNDQLRLVEANPRLCSLLGYSKEQLIAMKPTAFWPEVHSLFPYHRNLNETEVFFFSSYRTIANEDLIVFVQGRVLQKEDERLLLCTAKLVPCRTTQHLADHVIHEFRNHLASIKGFLYLTWNDQHHVYKEIMNREIEQLERLIYGITILTKPTSNSSQVNVRDVIDKSIYLLEKYHIVKRNQFEISTEHESLSINGHFEQLELLFHNLLKRIVLASFGSERVQVNLSKVKHSHIEVEIINPNEGTSKDGEWDEEKDVHLMSCRRIIQNHRGSLFINPISRGATRVLITFPVSK